MNQQPFKYYDKFMTLKLLLASILTAFFTFLPAPVYAFTPVKIPDNIPVGGVGGPNSADIIRQGPDDPRFPTYPGRNPESPTSGLTKAEIEATKHNNDGVTIYQGNRPKLPEGYSYVDAECSAFIQGNPDALGCINVGVNAERDKDVPAVIWNNRGEVVKSIDDIPQSESKGGSKIDSWLKNAGLPDVNTWLQNILHPVNPDTGISEGNSQSATTPEAEQKKDLGQRIQDALDAMKNTAADLAAKVIDAVTPNSAPAAPPPAETAPETPAAPNGGGLIIQ